MTTEAATAKAGSHHGAPALRQHPRRRDFLKAAALFDGAATVPRFWAGSVVRAAESPNGKRNVAPIGVGDRGSAIGQSDGPWGKLVACCDVNRNRPRQFASAYDGRCASYGDYRKVLERKDIDAVTIGTPDHGHAAIAIAALETRRDVYCEKPLTLTIEEGQLFCQWVQKTARIYVSSQKICRITGYTPFRNYKQRDATRIPDTLLLRFFFRLFVSSTTCRTILVMNS
jgi:hypothetical protein